jgi:hypothetical protein
MNRTIQYAIHPDGYSVSRVGREVAWPVLDFEGMKPENSYEMNYNYEKMSVHSVGREWCILKWTKKLCIEDKNFHRKLWGMKTLSSSRKQGYKWVHEHTTPM